MASSQHPWSAVGLAIATLVLAYTATTGIGAALFPFDFGQMQLRAHLYPESVDFNRLTMLGSPTYWAILLSLPLMAPVAAMLMARATEGFSARFAMPQVPVAIPIILAALMSAFCIYKLAMAGALSAHDAWDRSVCYEQKILRRVELTQTLGNFFYDLVYSSLPILDCYLLARGIMTKNRIALAAWVVLSAVIVWFDIAILFKAPVIIHIAMMGVTCWLSGCGFLRSALTAAVVAGGFYAGLSSLQFCDSQVKSWEVLVPRMSLQVEAPITSGSSPASPAPQKQAAEQTVPRESRPHDSPGLLHKAWYMTRAAAFRMAAGFPYYVQIFSDSDRRCGIVRPPRLTGEPRCFAPIVVFEAMYPDVTYTVGYQPAPINASAYAEGGPWYVLFATLACGIILGGIAGWARKRNPLSITIVIASCIYAYFATQSSLTGALIDSVGLVWLLLPIVGMVAASHLVTRVSRPVHP